MKILFHLESIQSGGVDTFTIRLLNNWPCSSDKLYLLCNDSHPGILDLKNGLSSNIEFVTYSIPLSWSCSSKYLAFISKKYRRIIQPLLRMILYKSQKRLLKKYFVSLHCEKLFVINGGYPGGETSRLANIVWHETYTTKSVHNFHNDAIRPRLFFRTFEDYIDKQLKVSVSEFVTVSHSCAQSLKVRKNLVEVEPLVIYNGIDSLSFRNRSLIENYLNKRSCIFIANYEPRKGHDFLFRVMEKVRQIIPDVSLDIYGAYDADQFENVKSLWLKNSPDLNVNLNGFKADIMLELQKFDVLLICSQEFESFGLTAIEAMAQGIPVVSTDVGGLKEVVGFEGNGGFLFDKFDIDGYSSKVIELLLNKDLRRLIGIRGIDNVRNKFSLNQMVIKYKKLIR